MRKYNGVYTEDNLRYLAFPLGGIGAGMFCIQGSGTLGNFSLRNEPDVHYEPNVFSALCIKGKDANITKVIEGQVPYYKIFGGHGDGIQGMGNGLHGKNYGLPRFKTSDFTARFPFAHLNFNDADVPLTVRLMAWSPFTPLDADSSSNPVATLEYTFQNPTDEQVEAVYYFSALNLMHVKLSKDDYDNHGAEVLRAEDGFILHQPTFEAMPHAEGSFYAAIHDEDISINTDWFDGGWFDVLTMQWNDITAGSTKDKHHKDNKSPGGSIALPFTLEPGEEKTIKVKLAWYVPKTSLRNGYEEDGSSCCTCCNDKAHDKPTHEPWYSAKYESVEAIMDDYKINHDDLYDKSQCFSNAFYASTLPDVVLDAVSANLSIIKSPTILRQKDGRLWCWEGCCDSKGCCAGSCTHVWNYAQALCHLFPTLERTLRQTEFNECQNEEGHQEFRASLPIRQSGHTFYAASDGQLGGIMKMHREWRISGDNEWLESYWGKITDSLDYCINQWDKKHQGVLTEPHHNTYDIEFWGADGMCSSFYLGALKAATVMGSALGKDIDLYQELYDKGRAYLESELFNGEYFYQKVDWTTLDAKLDIEKENANCRELLEKEGPKYQYGTGCLSDGILGTWMAKVCGLGDILDIKMVESHLISVYRYNFKETLINHANPQRPGYAVGDEAGLLLCSWPQGGKPSLPFVYSDEVWTGIEYQVASHLCFLGHVSEGLTIVKACRDRYDGTKRNAFNEYECGHWYARAMASYALLEALTGVRYDAPTKTLYVSSKNMDGYKTFLCTATGYAVVNVDGDAVTVDVRSGKIDVDMIIKD